MHQMDTRVSFRAVGWNEPRLEQLCFFRRSNLSSASSNLSAANVVVEPRPCGARGRVGRRGSASLPAASRLRDPRVSQHYYGLSVHSSFNIDVLDVETAGFPDNANIILKLSTAKMILS